MPHVFLADKAFPLHCNIMCPLQRRKCLTPIFLMCAEWSSVQLAYWHPNGEYTVRCCVCFQKLQSTLWGPPACFTTFCGGMQSLQYLLCHLLEHPQLSHRNVSRTHLALAPTMPAEMLWQWGRSLLSTSCLKLDKFTGSITSRFYKN